MAFTREPSGRRASTIGEDSSTLRPTRDTMRSMICSRWRSSRNDVSTFCSIPPRSIKTWSLSFTRMSEMVGIAQQRLQRTQAEDFIQQIGLDLLLLFKAQRHPLVTMISLIIPATACRAWPELTRDSFSRSSLEISVRCTSVLNFSRFSCSTLCHPRMSLPDCLLVLLPE